MRAGEKQRLIPREVIPGRRGTFINGMIQRIRENDPAQKEQTQIPVGDSSEVRLAEPFQNERKQPFPVNCHEESLHIEAERPAVPAVVIACGTQKAPRAVNPEESPLALAATVSVINKLAFEYRIYPGEKQMLHHAIPEIRSDDFAFHRFFVNEAHGWR